MSLMLDELIFAEKAIRNTLAVNGKTADDVAAAVKASDIRLAVTVARGTSNNAAAYYKYVTERNNGFMVSRFNHSVATIHGSAPRLSDSLVLGISQSGMSKDTIMVMEKARADGAVTVAVTNYPSSPLAKMCDYHLYLDCGEERSVAATKTFTMQLAVLDLLAARLCGGAAPDYAEIADGLSALISRFDEIKKLAEDIKDINNLLILSRGAVHCIADELGLKLLETCYKMSRCYSTAEFAHGPYALVEKDRPVILLAPAGVFSKDFTEIAGRIHSDGGRIISFTDIPEVAALSERSVTMPSEGAANPYLYTVCAQAFAAFMSEALGINPDKPRGLRKVTITL